MDLMQSPDQEAGAAIQGPSAESLTHAVNAVPRSATPPLASSGQAEPRTIVLWTPWRPGGPGRTRTCNQTVMSGRL